MPESKPIPGFSGYTVSDDGHVYSEKQNRLLVPYLNNYGNPTVGLMRNCRQHKRSLALLVARAFLEGETDIFDTPICLDGNRFNVNVNNLVWRPRWFAVKYNQQFNERRTIRIDKQILNKDTGEVFTDSFQAAIWYGLLEKDLVMSIASNTYVWPTFHFFEVIL